MISPPLPLVSMIFLDGSIFPNLSIGFLGCLGFLT